MKMVAVFAGLVVAWLAASAQVPGSKLEIADECLGNSLSKLSLKDDLRYAQDVSKKAESLLVNQFENEGDFQRYRVAAADLPKAADGLLRVCEKWPRTVVGSARLAVVLAAAQADSLNAQAATEPLSIAQVATFKEKAKRAWDGVSGLLGLTKPTSGLRVISVEIKPASAEARKDQYTAYVLMGSLVEGRPLEQVAIRVPDTLKALHIDLTPIGKGNDLIFRGAGEVPNGEYWVWVGQRDKYREMAEKLLRPPVGTDKRHLIGDRSSTQPQLFKFESTRDVVKVP